MTQNDCTWSPSTSCNISVAILAQAAILPQTRLPNSTKKNGGVGGFAFPTAYKITDPESGKEKMKIGDLKNSKIEKRNCECLT